MQEANESTSARAPESASVDNAVNSASRDTYDASNPRPPATPSPNVYVGNLFFDVTENDLQKEFSRFGEIKNVRIIRDARGLSKGYVSTHAHARHLF